jgi:hypothetical protein
VCVEKSGWTDAKIQKAAPISRLMAGWPKPRPHVSYPILSVHLWTSAGAIRTDTFRSCKGVGQTETMLYEFLRLCKSVDDEEDAKGDAFC